MNCKQATQLMSQAQDRELSQRERISLKIHLLICTGCNHYNKHMKVLRKAMQQLKNH